MNVMIRRFNMKYIKNLLILLLLFIGVLFVSFGILCDVCNY